jgi:hypothetical protein
VWNCNLCRKSRSKNKVLAIRHAIKNHGMIVTPSASKKNMVTSLLTNRVCKRRRITYTCPVDQCDLACRDAIEIFLHMRTDHNRDSEALCFQCDHPLEYSTTEAHWEKNHLNFLCQIDNCRTPLPKLSTYFEHMSNKHYDTLIKKITFKTQNKIYQKMKKGDEITEGWTTMRAMVPFAGPKNMVIPFDLHFDGYRKMYENSPEKIKGFNNIYMNYQDRFMFQHPYNQSTPDTTNDMDNFLSVQCQEEHLAQTENMSSILKDELRWHHMDPPILQRMELDIKCGECGDDEEDEKHTHCLKDMDDGEGTRLVHTLQHREHLTQQYQGTLYAAYQDTYKQIPKPEDRIILNISSESEDLAYATAYRGRIPGMIINGHFVPLTEPSYFDHLRRRLEILKKDIPIPLMVEFFSPYTPQNLQDMESQVKGFLEGIQAIEKKYQVACMILSPLPRIKEREDLGDYILSLTKTRQITKVLAAHSAAAGLALMPAEGYLFSIPISEDWKIWYCHVEENNERKLLRNKDGSPTSNMRARIMKLLEKIIDVHQKEVPAQEVQPY